MVRLKVYSGTSAFPAYGIRFLPFNFISDALIASQKLLSPSSGYHDRYTSVDYNMPSSLSIVTYKQVAVKWLFPRDIHHCLGSR